MSKLVLHSNPLDIPLGGLEREVDSDDDEVPVYKKDKGGSVLNEDDLMKSMLQKNLMNLPGATPMNTQIEEEDHQ